ncbi:TonB-dependent receptor [Rhodonellum sp.]|uniref:TonB-dependent receptor n=1 Tax=Rhodonellum sp. TaxID=2231180 RepID=UPI002718741E|nr:TonB-dependent receptor [Rhodonellum sp.]MDO9553897.1 TonB-dependent receptor [Rhodonellum sp.]
MINKILGILFIAFWYTGLTVAQEDCVLTIRGKVIHAENNEPIEGAYIWIKEIDRGAISDYNGNFRILNLCTGNYTVSVQYLGHSDYKESIVVTSNSNFTFRLEAEDITLEGVDIHGHQDAVITTSSVSSIRGAELRIARGETLGETLGRIPGVSSYSTGANISKPVIQGLHSNRIMILNNGIRLEGQQWGTEHAPEIDAFIAKEIAVVKGAETVRFGPEAMGGVILINPAPIPTKAGFAGELDLVGASNGRMVNTSVTISGGSKKWQGLGYRVQSSSKMAGNIQSPDYYQDNTGVRELNFSGALGYSNNKLGTELYFSHFQTSLGILSDAHTGNLSDLNGIIENGRPFRDSEFTYQIGNPKQQVDHQLLKLKSHYHLGNGSKLNLQYGFQRNHRREFDRRRGELNERASLDLELFSNTLDISFTHMTRKKWNGSVGLNLIQQANSNVPGTGVVPLIPNYDMKNVGIFVIEKYTSGPLEIEGGLRYDFRQVKSARIQNGELDDREFEFQNFSAFLGGVYALSRSLTFNSNLGSAWRPPNINEQFSQGLHHGLAAIEIGNPDFVSEQSYKWVNTLNFVDNNLRMELTGFANRINNYIYLSPSQEQFVSLRGSFAIFEYLQTDANLWGGDLSVNYTLTPVLELYSKGSIVRAKNIKENNFLPFISSDRLETGIILNMPTKDGVSNTKFTLGNLMVAKQTRVPDFDLAPAPPGYFLWNAAFQTSFKISDKTLNLGFQAKNIFNTSYKDYMNRFRYFTHDIGRNFLLKLNYEF